jgi:O-antigen ligase
MLDAVRGAVPIADWAPIAVNLPGAILWSTVLFVAGALFFVIRRASGGSHNLWAIIPLLTAALLEALIGLLQVAGGALYGTGTFNSRDHYCCFLELSLPLLGAAGWISVRQAREGSGSFLQSAVAAGMAWSAGLVILAGIFYSLSRAGAAVSLAGLAVFGALSMTPYLASRRARIGLATVLGLSVVIALVAFTPNALLSRFFQTAGADSATRLVFWKESLPIISHFPFVGTGLLGFESVFLHYQDIILTKRVDFAHNDYLQYLIELGFVGSILLVAVLAGVIGPVFKGAWKARDAQVRIWLAGCVGSFTALALHSAIDFNLYVPANVLAFAWIAGYASALTAARTGVRSLRRV